MTREIPAHPIALLFPLRDDETLDELRESIEEHGQKEAIVLYQDKVLDGRRRQRAAIDAHKRPLYREFGSRPEDGTDPLEFVFAVNYHRRELSETERLMAAASYANMKQGQNQHTKKGAAPSGNAAPVPVSTAEAARKFDVSQKQVARTKAVLERGVPELQEAVRDEVVSVSDASAITGEEPKVQQEAVKKVRAGQTRTLRAAVGEINPDPDEPSRSVLHAFDKLAGQVEQLEAIAPEDREKVCKWLRKARDLIKSATVIVAA